MIVYELQRKYQIKIPLEISGLKKSTYYYTLSKNNKDLKNDDIMNTIIDIYYAHKQRYGYRRITLELNNRGYVVNHKKVKRLMCIMDLYAITPKAKEIDKNIRLRLRMCIWKQWKTSLARYRALKKLGDGRMEKQGMVK